MDGRRRVLILDVHVDLERRVVSVRTDAEHEDPVICSDVTGAIGCRGKGMAGVERRVVGLSGQAA
jgi:hypothetical protein